MKNIIPFKKDVIFKTNISEITSISLEHTLSINDEKISGDFIISGDYKISDNSTSVEPFNLKIPFEVSLDDRFITDRATIDIDDFFYEIVNNSVLSIAIDLLIDKLEEKPIVDDEEFEMPKEVKKEIKVLEENIEFDNQDRNKELENVEDETVNIKEKMDSIFNKFNDEEKFVTYSICIVREGDSIESIIDKYGVNEDLIKEYNNLNDLKIGDKLIIPSINETN